MWLMIGVSGLRSAQPCHTKDYRPLSRRGNHNCSVKRHRFTQRHSSYTAALWKKVCYSPFGTQYQGFD